MKKNNKIILVIIIFTLIILSFSYYLINLNIEKSLISYWTMDNPNYIFYEYKVIRCNNKIIYPEVAFVAESQFKEYPNDFNIHFYNIIKPFDKTEENRKYIGSTTIKNTTFPELVKMVKEDCSQFQKAKGDSDDETINWSYSPAPTQEKLDELDAGSFWDMFDGYLPEAQAVFKEVYGNPYKMENAELAKLYKKIEKEGMDEKVYIKEMTTRFYNTQKNITDAQKKKLIEIYGEWENLTDKELADLAKKIQEELLSGEVSLD